MTAFCHGNEAVAVIDPIAQGGLVANGSVLPVEPAGTAHPHLAADEEHSLLGELRYFSEI